PDLAKKIVVAILVENDLAAFGRLAALSVVGDEQGGAGTVPDLNDVVQGATDGVGAGREIFGAELEAKRHVDGHAGACALGVRGKGNATGDEARDDEDCTNDPKVFHGGSPFLGAGVSALTWKCAARARKGPPFWIIFSLFFLAGLCVLTERLQFLVEPDSGERPIALDGSGGDADDGADLLHGEAAEVAELDDFGLARIFLLETSERFIEE